MGSTVDIQVLGHVGVDVPDRLAAGAHPLGNRLVVQPVGAQKHDLGTADEPGWQAARADKRLECLTGP